MADPINLNAFRKAKARAEKEARAAENRAKHGRTKAETSRDKAEREHASKIVDLHKRDD
ncbi:MAG: DUF4169 family protein [Pseudomonadota bacterium]